jgi:hypothetical protein
VAAGLTNLRAGADTLLYNPEFSGPANLFAYRAYGLRPKLWLLHRCIDAFNDRVQAIFGSDHSPGSAFNRALPVSLAEIIQTHFLRS